MAKENTVYLCGFVSVEPMIRMNDKNEFVSGKLILTTMRRTYATEEMLLKGTPRKDSPCVFSQDSELIKEKMFNIEKGDFVFVKGTLCTKESPKRYICPHCGNQTIKPGGVVVYVDPIYIQKLECVENEFLKVFKRAVEDRIDILNDYLEYNRSIPDSELSNVGKHIKILEENLKMIMNMNIGTPILHQSLQDVILHLKDYQSSLYNGENLGTRHEVLKKDIASLNGFVYHLLKSREEISNQVFIMGTLCKRGELYDNPETRKKEFDFQIASNRIRRILEDGPDKRTDYPWVKSFGSYAEEYSKALDVNSSVFINGAIQTREIKQKFVCDNCSMLYERPSVSMEIVPYHVEYMANCNIPEESYLDDFDEDFFEDNYSDEEYAE